MSEWEDPDHGKKKKKKKKDKRDKDELSDRGDFGGGGGDFGGGFGIERTASDFDGLSPSYGAADRFGAEMEELRCDKCGGPHITLECPLFNKDKHMTFAEVMAADREVVGHLRREFDTCHEHLRRETGADERLQRDVDGMRSQISDLGHQERKMLEAVREAKERLRVARCMHRELDLNDLSAGRDRSMVAEELEFLSKRLDSDGRALRNAREANGQLMRHSEDLEMQMVNLEKERSDIGKEVKQEQETVKEDQKRIGELRNEVETVRRQLQFREAQRREQELQEERYREIKHAIDGGPEHSWALDVVSPGGAFHRDHGHGPRPPATHAGLAKCAASSSPVSSRSSIRTNCRTPFSSPSGKSPQSPGSPQWGKGMGTQAPGIAVHF